MIDICEQDLKTIGIIIYDVIIYFVYVISTYKKSVHCFNNITSLDVSLKTCKPGSKVVQYSLSGRVHLGILLSEQLVQCDQDLNDIWTYKEDDRTRKGSFTAVC